MEFAGSYTILREKYIDLYLKTLKLNKSRIMCIYVIALKGIGHLLKAKIDFVVKIKKNYTCIH